MPARCNACGLTRAIRMRRCDRASTSQTAARGIPEFGPDVTAKFCKDNHIFVIRAHQFLPAGL